MAGLLDVFGFGRGGVLPMAPGYQPPSGGDLGTAFQNFAAAHSLLGGIANAITGATTGQRTDPLGASQQFLAAQEQALTNAGIHPALAHAAVLNPEVMRGITGGFDLTPKLTKTGQVVDPFTGQTTEQFSVYRPAMQSLTPITPARHPAQLREA
jgi:hypothetical protein